MKRRTFTAAWLASSASLVGCAGPSIKDYAGAKPLLDLRQYFSGHLVAHGMFSDRSGKVLRRFVVDMNCRWQGNEGEFDEDFTYDDGEKQKRIWRLRHLGEGRYVGTADDVRGEAHGAIAGNTFRWGYTLALPYEGRVLDVQFDDWMHLIDETVMLNRAVMSKFGIRLGEVQLVFRKS